MVDIETGEIQNSDISWGGGDDSFYEYLIKMFVYDQKRFKEHKDRYDFPVLVRVYPFLRVLH